MRTNGNLDYDYIGMQFANFVDGIVNKIMDFLAHEVEEFDIIIDSFIENIIY